MSTTFTTSVAGGPEGINLNDRNAAQVLNLLGCPTTDEDLWGEDQAETFLGRILLAQALLDVTVDDEQGLPAIQDGRWYEGGRRPGYMAEKLAELHSLAEWARSHGADVHWG